jgi:hypothetical protein
MRPDVYGNCNRIAKFLPTGAAAKYFAFSAESLRNARPRVFQMRHREIDLSHTEHLRALGKTIYD